MPDGKTILTLGVYRTGKVPVGVTCWVGVRVSVALGVSVEVGQGVRVAPRSTGRAGTVAVELGARVGTAVRLA